MSARPLILDYFAPSAATVVGQWSAAVVGAGGTVSAGYGSALTTLVDTCKQNGIWTFDWFQPLATENTQQAIIDVAGLRTGALIGAPVFTALFGYQFNGSTTGYNSNFNPLTQGVYAQQNNNCFGGVVETSQTDAQPPSSSAYFGNSSGQQFWGRVSTTQHWSTINNNGSSNVNLGPTAAHFHIRRTGAAATAAFQGSTLLYSPNVTSVAFASATFVLGGCNNGAGGVTRASNGRLAFGYMGRSLNGQEALFDTALMTFLHAINPGRW